MDKELDDNLEFVWGEEYAEGSKELEAVTQLKKLIEHKPSVGFEEKYIGTVADVYAHYLEMKYKYRDMEDSEKEAEIVIGIVKAYFIANTTE